MKKLSGITREASERMSSHLQKRVQARNAQREWEDYEAGQEEAELGSYLDQIEARLREVSPEKGNQYVYSNDWKDPDLNPGGSNGISKISTDLDNLEIEISCHKTFVDPAYEEDHEAYPEGFIESISDTAGEIVSGAGGDGMWTGDDWSFSNKAYATVRDPGNVEDAVSAIIDAYDNSEELKNVEENWTEVDGELNVLYDDMIAKSGAEHF